MHGNMKAPEKVSDFKGALKNILKFNKSNFSLIIIALILSALASILSIIGPDKLKEITNLITIGLKNQIDLDKIKKIGLILVIFYALSFIFNYIQGYIMNIVTNKFALKMREKIAFKINKLPLSYFDKVKIGDVLSRVTNDVDTMCATLNQSLSTLVSALTMFLGSIFMMFYTNAILALTSILSSLLGFFLMAIIMKRSQKYFVRVQNGLGNINGLIEESFTGHNIIKVYNATDENLNNFDELNDLLFKDNLKSQFYSGLMHPIMGFIGNFGYVMVSIIGSILVINNNINFGVIIAFMIYVRLFTNPLSQFAQVFTSLQSAAAASERVFTFLDLKEMNKEVDFVKLDSKNVKGNLEFQNVKFGYDEKLVIKGFSTKVKSGEKIAIVGPTGAGKTTIVNLLMKFYEINSGDIKIDNISINKLTRENVHELFTMVLQDTWVFNGTIKENIIYNQKNVTDEQIIEICKSIGFDHFVKTLPHGYDTVISDSEGLSAGEKQLLTIARSMIQKTPFLILDEATSNVDSRTEVLVQNAMDKLTKGRTSFIIAHRLSTIINADHILVIKDGNIIEQGNHDELIKKAGFYKELYDSQFQNV